jgi:hypothetical protein
MINLDRCGKKEGLWGRDRKTIMTVCEQELNYIPPEYMYNILPLYQLA